MKRLSAKQLRDMNPAQVAEFYLTQKLDNLKSKNKNTATARAIKEAIVSIKKINPEGFQKRIIDGEVKWD